MFRLFALAAGLAQDDFDRKLLKDLIDEAVPMEVYDEICAGCKHAEPPPNMPLCWGSMRNQLTVQGDRYLRVPLLRLEARAEEGPCGPEATLFSPKESK